MTPSIEERGGREGSWKKRIVRSGGKEEGTGWEMSPGDERSRQGRWMEDLPIQPFLRVD